MDGIKESDLSNSFCAYTLDETFPWWRVDLGKLALVYSVAVMKANDRLGTKLTNFYIRVGESVGNNGNSNPLCRVGKDIAAGQTKEFICLSLLKGRYVNVQLRNENKALGLCEVEAYGTFYVPF